MLTGASFCQVPGIDPLQPGLPERVFLGTVSRRSGKIATWFNRQRHIWSLPSMTLRENHCIYG
jgi:hypothetical protein